MKHLFRVSCTNEQANCHSHTLQANGDYDKKAWLDAFKNVVQAIILPSAMTTVWQSHCCYAIKYISCFTSVCISVDSHRTVDRWILISIYYMCVIFMQFIIEVFMSVYIKAEWLNCRGAFWDYTVDRTSMCNMSLAVLHVPTSIYILFRLHPSSLTPIIFINYWK